MRLVLVGLRGSGKTTSGRAAAARLGAPFVDTDDLVEARGRSIAALFAEEGEAGFRRIERQVIAALDPPDPAVVATGGGAVLHPDNRARLATLGPVVYLRADPRTLALRVRADPRPALAPGGPEAEARALLRQREPLYRGLSRHEIDTSSLTAEQVAERLVALAARDPRSGS
jgi:shikimate kinase